VITQDFVRGAGYAAMAEAANTFGGLLHEGAHVVRGEGERQKERTRLAASQYQIGGGRKLHASNRPLPTDIDGCCPNERLKSAVAASSS
jgi:hypothetical protein